MFYCNGFDFLVALMLWLMWKEAEHDVLDFLEPG